MSFKIERSVVIWFVIVNVLVCGGVILKKTLDYNNIEGISYNKRTYIKSTIQTMDINLKKAFDKTKPTGHFSKGMEVYDVEGNPYDSTIVFLKTKDDKFLVYSLSGGP